MRKDFVLLAGMWFGPTKPKMSVILEPVLEEISRLNILGAEVLISEWHCKDKNQADLVSF